MHIFAALGLSGLITFIVFPSVLDLENLTPQLTELKQKMEPLTLKMKMLDVNMKDDSAAKPASGGDPGHQEAQLLDHTSLIAEHASLLATFKTLESKHLDQTNEFEKLRRDHHSQEIKFNKLRQDYQCKQTEFASQQVLHNDLQREHTTLKDDHETLKTQHQELQSKVEDSKRSESIHWCFFRSIVLSKVLCVNKNNELWLENTIK